MGRHLSAKHPPAGVADPTAVALLAKFGIEIEDAVSKSIESGPREWKNLQKKLFAK